MDQKQKRANPIAIIILLIIILAIVGGISQFFSSDREVVKGPATESIKFKEIEKENVKKALLDGEIDMYSGSLSGEDAKELANNPNFILYPATSKILGLYVNPYPEANNQINPFSIKEVRYAMQFLVDRQKIVDEAFSGFAAPTLTMPWDGHPDYENIKGTVDEMGISYDKEKAKALIKEGMEKSGAISESGIWMYKNKPVNINISYVGKDQFLKIAEILKSSLEEAGFTVTLIYTDADDPEAKDPESYTNAADLKWNIAISGWIFYSQSTKSNVSILEPYASKGWWEYKNEEIDKLEEEQKNFKDEENRIRINNELAKKYLEDSTCVWLLTADNISVAKKEVKGLIQDKFIGITNITNIREAYIPGKNSLIVGVPKIYEEKDSWNNWVINNINMMYLFNTIHDPAKWNETSSLKDSGFRWSFDVDNQGSEAVIDVPSDSFIWNAEEKKWKGAGEGKKAITKVTYDLSNYIGTKWHYGEEITQADVIYNIARFWDISFDAKKQEIDGDWGQDILKPIMGIRIQDKKLEVYLNKWSIDEGDLLDITRIFQRAAPWELYAATDDLVFAQRAYDYQYVDGSEREKLNLVRPEHVAAIFKTLKAIEFEKIQPMMTMGDKAYAEKADLDSRISSLENWYANHSHLYINEGPFYVDKFNLADKTIELKAFRDQSYPFSAGHWRK